MNKIEKVPSLTEETGNKQTYKLQIAVSDEKGIHGDRRTMRGKG